MGDSPPLRAPLHLRLLATTDLHGHLADWDYFTDSRQALAGGLARLAPLIAQARDEAENSLLFDNGDLLQGSILTDLLAADGWPDADAHPMIAALDALGCDAATPGNHDFDHGLDYLSRAVSGAGFPMVCANVDNLDGTPFLPREALLRRCLRDAAGNEHTLVIGVTGVLPALLLRWNADLLADRVVARDMVPAAKAAVARLRAGGADLVVVLAHSGLSEGHPEREVEHAVEALAAIDGVDAVIGGHSHRVFPAAGTADLPRGRVPVVLAGCLGSHLGVIDLVLRRRRDGGWSVSRAHAATRAALADAPDAVDPVLAPIAGPAHARTLARVRAPFGRISARISSHFTLLGDMSALTPVHEVQTAWAQEAAMGTEWDGLPVVSAAAPFKAGGPGMRYVDIPAGPVGLRHVADLYGFPNTAVALLVTGSHLRDWLERAAALYRSLAGGIGDQPLIDPAGASFFFDVISGLTWTIDLSAAGLFRTDGSRLRNGARRVGDLRHRGRPVAPGDRFVLVTNSYRAGGGGAFPGVAEMERLPFETVAVRDLLIRRLQTGVPVDPRAPCPWRFQPLSGAGAIYDTCVDCATPLPGLEPVHPAASGLARFRMRL